MRQKDAGVSLSTLLNNSNISVYCAVVGYLLIYLAVGCREKDDEGEEGWKAGLRDT